MINKILLGITLFYLAVVMWVFWLMFAPVQLSIIYNEPFPVFPSQVKHGEDINYVIEFTKRDTYHVETNMNIICADGTLVTLASKPSNAPLGESKVMGSITIPEKTSLGKCYLELKPTYHINAFREESRTLRTQEFTVIE